jgi:hypothetical protein
MRLLALCALVAAPVLFGCSGPDPDLIADVDGHSHGFGGPTYEVRAPLRTMPWVSDFRLGASLDKSGRLTELKTQFAPGGPIYLSMQVNDVPRNTVVSTYWYGPNNLTLGYETSAVSAGQQRLRFVQGETRGWPPGACRVEVWIGEDKIGTKTFDIVRR